MYYLQEYNSIVGKIFIASDENAIVGAWIQGQKYYMNILESKEYENKETNALKMAKEWLDRYFNGERPNIDELHINLVGSNFRKSVWKILKDIPYGEVITYGDIAKKIAKQKGLKTMSAQAVGGAVRT